ncbi:MAG TPA: hypothetical protein VI612_05600 [Candidatus Nanoarchaeia archaeon]|nr:hypothetical protein [Candidatus Nanoarchaeia archaeon]
MKKGLLLVVLLATIAYGEVIESNFSTIPRYSDFPLDNIHILRLQEASTSLGGNVSEMRQMLATFKDEQNAQMAEVRSTMDSLQRSMSERIAGMQSAVDSFSQRAGVAPAFAVPAEITFPPYLFVLLGANIFLLVLIIILIFWLREQYYVHRETHAEEHIHPAPKELVDYVGHAFEHKRSLRDIRMELAGKGWSPSIIEHAIHAAREK